MHPLTHIGENVEHLKCFKTFNTYCTHDRVELSTSYLADYLHSLLFYGNWPFVSQIHSLLSSLITKLMGAQACFGTRHCGSYGFYIMVYKEHLYICAKSRL